MLFVLPALSLSTVGWQFPTLPICLLVYLNRTINAQISDLPVYIRILWVFPLVHLQVFIEQLLCAKQWRLQILSTLDTGELGSIDC